MQIETVLQVSSCFENFALCQLVFMKDIQLMPIFIDWKKSRGFLLLQKKKKSENSIQHLFCSALLKYQCTHCIEWYDQTFCQETTLSSSASSYHSFELCLWVSMLYLNLFCVFIRKIWLKVIASLLYTILAYERFHRNVLLFIQWGTLMIGMDSFLPSFLSIFLFLFSSPSFLPPSPFLPPSSLWSQIQSKFLAHIARTSSTLLN